MNVADYYDSPEEVAKCLSCPFEECVECMNQPRAERWERDAERVRKYLLDGYGRLQIQNLLKMKKPYMDFIISRSYATELADENDKHFINLIYKLWQEGLTIRQIADEIELPVAVAGYHIHKLGLK